MYHHPLETVTAGSLPTNTVGDAGDMRSSVRVQTVLTHETGPGSHANRSCQPLHPPMHITEPRFSQSTDGNAKQIELTRMTSIYTYIYIYYVKL